MVSKKGKITNYDYVLALFSSVSLKDTKLYIIWFKHLYYIKMHCIHYIYIHYIYILYIHLIGTGNQPVRSDTGSGPEKPPAVSDCSTLAAEVCVHMHVPEGGPYRVGTSGQPGLFTN